MNNLFDCAKRLNLKSQTICSAAIYYHKFFRRLKKDKSDSSSAITTRPPTTGNESLDPDLIACTCLYLASKVEENPVKCKDLLFAFNECVSKNDELSFAKFTELSASIVFCEMLVCQLIDFDLNNQLPHNHLLHYLKSLNEWLFDDRNHSVQFSNLCWSLLADFYRDEDSIRRLFEPQEIAIAILQLSIRVFKDNLEQNHPNLERILGYTDKLYDRLDKANLWRINLILMKTFQFK